MCPKCPLLQYIFVTVKVDIKDTLHLGPKFPPFQKNIVAKEDI